MNMPHHWILWIFFWPLLCAMGSLASERGLWRLGLGWTSVLGTSGLTALAALWIPEGSTATFGGFGPEVGVTYEWTCLRGYGLGVVLSLSALALVGAAQHGSDASFLSDRAPAQALSFSLFLLAALCGLIMTSDLFHLFVMIEITALAGVIVVGLHGRPQSSLSAFRLMSWNMVASMVLLLAIGGLLGLSGYLWWPAMQQVGQEALLESSAGRSLWGLAGLFLVVSLGWKIGWFPGAVWVARGYHDAPPAVRWWMLHSGGKAVVMAAWSLRPLVWVAAASWLWPVLMHGSFVLGVGALGVVAWRAQTGAFRWIALTMLMTLYAFWGHLWWPESVVGVWWRVWWHHAVVTLMLQMLWQWRDRLIDGVVWPVRLMLASEIGIPGTWGFAVKWQWVQACLLTEGGTAWAVVFLGMVIFSVGLMLPIWQRWLDAFSGKVPSPPRGVADWMVWSVSWLMAALVLVMPWVMTPA
jgi:formate hydrogenlyase subunit 3/multisubunit Na+/H+ antiporter MnhD subunit